MVIVQELTQPYDTVIKRYRIGIDVAPVVPTIMGVERESKH